MRVLVSAVLGHTSCSHARPWPRAQRRPLRARMESSFCGADQRRHQGPGQLHKKHPPGPLLSTFEIQLKQQLGLVDCQRPHQGGSPLAMELVGHVVAGDQGQALCAVQCPELRSAHCKWRRGAIRGAEYYPSNVKPALSPCLYS